MINYFCNSDEIENNAKEALQLFEAESNIEKIAVFPDIHYCSEKNLPVGVAFQTKGMLYPLITGKDVGCGVMFLRFSKKDWIKPFNKAEHYRAFDKLSYSMTDDGLGGGNHFLSIEEGDDGNMYIICHTGSPNLGIYMYQKFYGILQNYSHEIGKQVSCIPLERVAPEVRADYERTLKFAVERRKLFVTKTLAFLQRNGYVSEQAKTQIQDTMHNHFRIQNDGKIFHRKGATELFSGGEAVIPLSMTRGSLIVTPKEMHYYLDEGKHEFPYYRDETPVQSAVYSCSHGAGRRLSRTDAMRFWKSGLKEKERKAYMENFSELLDRSGKFPNGYIQEFDFAYKTSDTILKDQPFLNLVATTRPIVTVKFTEI
jgi:RNA-splicing ligase RtcB